MYYRIKKLCIKLVIKISLYHDARSEKHKKRVWLDQKTSGMQDTHTHTHTQRWLTAALKEFPAAADGLLPRDRLVTTASPPATRTTNHKTTSQALLSRTFLSSSFFPSLFIIIPYFLSLSSVSLPTWIITVAVSRRPPTAGTWVQRQGIPRGICCGQSGIRNAP
jgi:VIT1/CCC1 family predicted Fe2+/Mn2+ transporter